MPNGKIFNKYCNKQTRPKSSNNTIDINSQIHYFGTMGREKKREREEKNKTEAQLLGQQAGLAIAQPTKAGKGNKHARTQAC